MAFGISKALVVVASWACGVLAARQKAGLDSSSTASQVLDVIQALLNEKHTGKALQVLQQVSAKSGEAITPGVENGFDQTLKEVIERIETDVEKKIKDAHEATQAGLDQLYTRLENSNRVADNSKEAADEVDKSHFECVADEQAKRAAVESAEEELSSARNNENEACQLQQDNKDFPFDTDEKMDCDMSVQGNCDSQLDAYIAKIRTDAAAALAREQQKYDGFEATCNQNRAAKVQAQSSLNAAEDAWSSKRAACEELHFNRAKAVCNYGAMMKAKCSEEGDYRELVAATNKAGGDSNSEPDRVEEWTTAGTTKCVLEQAIQKGLDTPVDGGDVQTCESKVDFEEQVGKLNRREAGFDKLASSNQCAQRPVTFYNGQEWQVPTDPKPKASSYVRKEFKPLIDLERGFDFCGGIGEQDDVGGTLHLIEDGDCGMDWSIVKTSQTHHIDNQKYHVGATLASWGCDRLKLQANVAQLQVVSGADQVANYAIC